jgi:hypothetical protein
MKVTIIRMVVYCIICSVLSILVSCDIEDYPYLIARGKQHKQTVRFFRLATPNANSPFYNVVVMNNLESRFQTEGFIASYLGVKTIEEMKDQMSQVSFVIIHDDADVTVTADERTILLNYLKDGGFIWIDNCAWNNYYDIQIFNYFPGMFDSSTIEYLTSDSPINNLKYGFTHAPASQWNASTQIGVARVDGSIVLISTAQDYFCQMDPGWSSDATMMENAFKYAVNVALYAISR